MSDFNALRKASSQVPVERGGGGKLKQFFGFDPPPPNVIKQSTAENVQETNLLKTRSSVSNTGKLKNFFGSAPPEQAVNNTTNNTSNKDTSTDYIKRQSIFDGSAPLIVDTEFAEKIKPKHRQTLMQSSNMPDPVNLNELKRGVSVKKYTHYELPRDVIIKLSSDESILNYSEHGFIEESLCFSLIYGGGSVDFSVDMPKSLKTIVKGLIYVINKLKYYTTFKSAIESIWLSTHNNDASLDYNLVLNLVQSKMDSTFNPKAIQFHKKFKTVDKDRDDKINMSEFVKLIYMSRHISSLQPVFDSFSTHPKFMSIDCFEKFLEDSQRELIETDVIKDRFSILGLDLNKQSITYDAFCNYLLNTEWNNAFDDEKYGHVYQDMDLTLPEFFISSSHNTYLSGDQLRSKSQTKMYAYVLRDGCRCVELDCWDGKQGHPEILHGNTLTSRIKFRSVVKCIAENSFVTSPYPVILSLENHCSIAQQEIMAKDFKEIFGDKLAIPPSSRDFMPTLNQLQYKILLKGAMLTTTQSTDGMDLDKVKFEKVADSLSAITYLKSVKIDEFVQASLNPFEMSSFEESRMEKIYKNQCGAAIVYNRTQLSRVYPNGKRVDSSNYSPFPAWNCGAHMVALNWQTPSEPLWFNEAKFLDNGRCGYVEKPALMKTSDFDPSNKASINSNSSSFILNVNIICARILPKPQKGKNNPSKYFTRVEVKVDGAEADQYYGVKTGVCKTSELFAPEWNFKARFDIRCPDLAIILFRIDVSTKVSKVKVAFASLPVKAIRHGYRAVPLKDHKGKNSLGVLLVHFDVPITSSFLESQAEFKKKKMAGHNNLRKAIRPASAILEPDIIEEESADTPESEEGNQSQQQIASFEEFTEEGKSEEEIFSSEESELQSNKLLPKQNKPQVRSSSSEKIKSPPRPTTEPGAWIRVEKSSSAAELQLRKPPPRPTNLPPSISVTSSSPREEVPKLIFPRNTSSCTHSNRNEHTVGHCYECNFIILSSPIYNKNPMLWTKDELIIWFSHLQLVNSYNDLINDQAMDGNILVEYLNEVKDWKDFRFVAMGDIVKLRKHREELLQYFSLKK